MIRHLKFNHINSIISYSRLCFIRSIKTSIYKQDEVPQMKPSTGICDPEVSSTVDKIKLRTQQQNEDQLDKIVSDIRSKSPFSITNPKNEFSKIGPNYNNKLASTLKSVVAADNRQKINGNYIFKTLNVLTTLVQQNKISFKDVENHKYYDHFLSCIQGSGHSLSEYNIIISLISLRNIGLAEDHPLIQTLQHDLLFLSENLNITLLLRILLYFNTYKDNKSTDLIVKKIENLGTNIEMKPSDFGKLYSVSNIFSSKYMDLIEAKLQENMEDFDHNSLAQVFMSVVNSKKRVKPFLKTLSYHMFKKEESLTASHIVALITAMKRINFYNQALLVKLTTDFTNQIDKVTDPDVISRMLRVVGTMRYFDSHLMTHLNNWVNKNTSLHNPQLITNLLFTTAVLSYQSDSPLQEFSSSLTPQSIGNNGNLVNFVWSLVVLGIAEKKHLDYVLTHEFIKSLNAGKYTAVGTALKMLNIFSVSQYIHKLENPIKYTDVEVDVTTLTQNKEILDFSSKMSKVVDRVYPSDGCSRKNIFTRHGFWVDLEVIVNGKLSPLPIEDYTTDFGTKQSKNSLPPGGKKIAVIYLNYNDYTFGTPEQIGQVKFRKDLLNKVGYKVALIPYFDFNTKSKIDSQVHYLNKQILNAYYS